MIEDYQTHEHLMIGVQKVERAMVTRYGIVKLRAHSQEIENIVEKPSIDDAPSQLADFGRMIPNKEIMDILLEIPLAKDNELWTVDAIRQYVERGGSFWPKRWIMENG
jgi:UTP--glucose-1-phosphate uridylyltransferase